MRRPHQFKSQEIKDVLWSLSKVNQVLQFKFCFVHTILFLTILPPLRLESVIQESSVVLHNILRGAMKTLPMEDEEEVWMIFHLRGLGT